MQPQQEHWMACHWTGFWTYKTLAHIRLFSIILNYKCLCCRDNQHLWYDNCIEIPEAIIYILNCMQIVGLFKRSFLSPFPLLIAFIHPYFHSLEYFHTQTHIRIYHEFGFFCLVIPNIFYLVSNTQRNSSVYFPFFFFTYSRISIWHPHFLQSAMYVIQKRLNFLLLCYWRNCL